jgi:hypothetical protein
MQGEITEIQVHFWLVLVMFALAIQAFILLLLVNAPYGRFARAGWGPTMSTRSAWVLFESPAVVVFAAIYFAGDNAWERVPLILSRAGYRTSVITRMRGCGRYPSSLVSRFFRSAG